MPQLMDAVDQIPPVSELQQYDNDSALKQHLDRISPLLFPLLKWLLCSTFGSISLIPARDQQPDLQTPYQYKLESAAPEHELAFQEWQREAARAGRGGGTGGWWWHLTCGGRKRYPPAHVDWICPQCPKKNY